MKRSNNKEMKEKLFELKKVLEKNKKIESSTKMSKEILKSTARIKFLL